MNPTNTNRNSDAFYKWYDRTMTIAISCYLLMAVCAAGAWVVHRYYPEMDLLWLGGLVCAGIMFVAGWAFAAAGDGALEDREHQQDLEVLAKLRSKRPSK